MWTNTDVHVHALTATNDADISDAPILGHVPPVTNHGMHTWEKDVWKERDHE
ncbi:hypothetical protein [Arthrobacter sp. UYEF21]|uniref:hypothetical protein n=1 Tax=Arthrobacter sp. UYEF21 TaxID=1756364 RepID=UPI0033978035